MQPRAVYRSRGRNYLVALRDGCCDKDDGLVLAHLSHVPGIYLDGGERSGSRDVARRSRGRSCLVALRDGRCDNDDATFDSRPLLYIGRCETVTGEAEIAACRLSFERAPLISSRYAMINCDDDDDGHPKAYRYRVL